MKKQQRTGTLQETMEIAQGRKEGDRVLKPSRKTYQIWSQFRRIIGDSELLKTYKVEKRQLQRWTADPRFADGQSNPLDRLEWVLESLMELGRQEVARSAVARLAHIVGCELVSLDSVTPDKDCWKEELMDDLPAFADFQEAARAYMEGRIGFEGISAAKEDLIREIKETVVKLTDERGMPE